MNQRELINQIRGSQKSFAKFAIPCLLAFLGIGMFMAVFEKKLKSMPPNLSLLCNLGAMGILALLVVAIIWRVAKSQKAICCPHCKASLVSTLGPIAIATGNCGACGKRIIEPEANQSA